MYEIERVHLQTTKRFFEHALGRGYFGRDEGLLPIADFFEQLADRTFGFPIGRRGVDHPRTVAGQCFEYFFTCLALIGRRRAVIVGADADHGQSLAGFRDLFGE